MFECSREYGIVSDKHRIVFMQRAKKNNRHKNFPNINFNERKMRERANVLDTLAFLCLANNMAKIVCVLSPSLLPNGMLFST